MSHLCIWDDVEVPASRRRDRFCSERCRQLHHASTHGHRVSEGSSDRTAGRAPFDPREDVEIHLSRSVLDELDGEIPEAYVPFLMERERNIYTIDSHAPHVDDQTEWQNSWWARSSRERP